jgi:hypothetical protein
METPGNETPDSEAETRRVEPSGGRGHGSGGGPGVTVNWPTGARLPVPGNAEWALWFCVEVVFAIIWAASDAVDAGAFVLATAAITFAYLISRGIAKASRVLEQ